MGTNYYHHRDVCPCCKRPAKVEHIGKSSMGWTFSFHGTGECRSYEDWLRVLEAGGIIVDEYGIEVTLDDFKAMVAAKKGAPNHHATWMREHYPDSEDEWEDDHGHSFSRHEFS